MIKKLNMLYFFSFLIFSTQAQEAFLTCESTNDSKPFNFAASRNATGEIIVKFKNIETGKMDSVGTLPFCGKTDDGDEVICHNPEPWDQIGRDNYDRLSRFERRNLDRKYEEDKKLMINSLLATREKLVMELNEQKDTTANFFDEYGFKSQRLLRTLLTPDPEVVCKWD